MTKICGKPRTHGMTGTRIYDIWTQMKSRCGNPSHKDYHHYGGRGIIVCGRWKDSFEAFYSDMGPRPSNRHTLDREDNEGDYNPENCRWATMSQQNRNKSTNRLLTIAGETKCIAEWAKTAGLTPSILYARLSRGWSDEEAVSRPKNPWRISRMAEIKNIDIRLPVSQKKFLQRAATAAGETSGPKRRYGLARWLLKLGLREAELILDKSAPGSRKRSPKPQEVQA